MSITEKDFYDAIMTSDNIESDATLCFKLAKKMLSEAQATLPDDIYLKENKGKEIEIAGVKYKYRMYAKTNFGTTHYRYVKNKPIQ